MSSPQPSLDIVTVSIALATWVVGVEAAQVVGPYSVILLCAIGGATWSASARPPASRVETLRYVLWMTGLALIATVPLAELAARWIDIEKRWTFAPIAVVVAARPDWILRQVRRFLESRYSARDEGPRP